MTIRERMKADPKLQAEFAILADLIQASAEHRAAEQRKAAAKERHNQRRRMLHAWEKLAGRRLTDGHIIRPVPCKAERGSQMDWDLRKIGGGS